MIPGVNISIRKASLTNLNRAGGSRERSDPLSGGISGLEPPKKIFEALKSV